MKTEKFLIAKLVFSPSLTVWVGSRSFRPDYLYSGSPHIFGILKEVSGFGVSMGELIPDQRSGTLTLDANRGSTGADTCIYDYLEDRDLVGQAVELYAFERRPGTLGVSGDLAIEFKGFCSALTLDTQSNLLVMQVEGSDLPTFDPLFRLDKSIFPQLEDGSSGQTLPACYNGAEAQGVFIREYDETVSGSTYQVVEYALASALTRAGGAHIFNYSDSLPRPKFKDYKEDWGDCTDGNLYSGGPTTTSFFSTNTWGSDLFCLSELGMSFGNIDSTLNAQDNNKIVTHVNIKPFPLMDAGGPPFEPGDHKWFVKVYQLFPGGVVGPVVAQGEVLKSLYASHFIPANNGVTINVLVPLDKPVVMTNPAQFFFSVGQTSEQISADAPWTGQRTSTFIQARTISSASSYYRQVFSMELTDNQGWAADLDTWLGNQLVPAMAFLGASFELQLEYPNPPLASRMVSGFSKLKFWSYKKPGETNPDLKLIPNPIMSLSLRDGNNFLGNGLGQPVTLAPDIVKMFDSSIDTATFSPKTNTSAVRARYDGGSVRQFLLECIENTASKIIPRRSGALSFWTFGAAVTPSKTLTEVDCRVEGINITGRDEIVNRASISFGRFEERGGYNDLVKREDTGSQLAFGVRDLDLTELNFCPVGSPNVVRYLTQVFARFSKPRWLISVSVPFWREDLRAIEVLDLIYLNHVALPSAFGARPSDIENPITTDGVSLGVDYNLGAPLRKAKSLLCEVVSRSPEWLGEEMRLNLILEVKQNAPW